MRNWQTIKAAAITLCVIGCSVASEEAPQPEFVAEIIVRFSADQPIGGAIADSINKGGELSSDINRLTAALSDETGVPLVAQRITSGHELILQVRSDPLLVELEQHVADQEDVAECHRTSDQHSTPYRRDEVVVSFEQGSKRYAILQELELSSDRSDPALVEFTETLTRGFDYPVTPRRLPSGELALSIDTGLLTTQLVEALSRRDDVDYAQPNFTMQYN